MCRVLTATTIASTALFGGAFPSEMADRAVALRRLLDRQNAEVDRLKLSDLAVGQAHY